MAKQTAAQDDLPVMDSCINANDLRLHYLGHGGSGPELILLPGLTASNKETAINIKLKIKY